MQKEPKGKREWEVRTVWNGTGGRARTCCSIAMGSHGVVYLSGCLANRVLENVQGQTEAPKHKACHAETCKWESQFELTGTALVGVYPPEEINVMNALVWDCYSYRQNGHLASTSGTKWVFYQAFLKENKTYKMISGIFQANLYRVLGSQSKMSKIWKSSGCFRFRQTVPRWLIEHHLLG